ncbi:MAG: M20/M25/M40 family metallo-hydrolase [Oscillospiraceae bacterium]|nr:M20/M25/M40 family metallo-hydrolase [Oscillospiraceae bacterium]
MIEKFISENIKELESLLLTLCRIPSPTGQEQRRSSFIYNWCRNLGVPNVTVDDTKNVIISFGCEDYEDITVFMAHMDTVFPDTSLLPLRIKGRALFCPGCGDNTANLSIMLMCIKFLLTHPEYRPKCGVLFVANTCEEGLGNLKGCSEVMKAYGKRVKKVIVLDGTNECILDRSVGSSRYRIEIDTIGGHSFDDFGNPNAIKEMSSLVNDLYSIEVPVIGNSITTYNIGVMNGGTAINSIAQHAEILYEYRSDNAECLEIMKDKFVALIKQHREKDLRMAVTHLGTRPCMMNVDKEKQAELTMECSSIIEKYLMSAPILKSGSTDANIPLSMGIPSVCLGLYYGGNAHTRDEWLDLDSLDSGFHIALELVQKYFKAIPTI